MHNAYTDIITVATEAQRLVQWWDENGVPRFAPHDPHYCPDIYATEVALLLIACQSCRHQFNVQMSSIQGGRWLNDPVLRKLSGPALLWALSDSISNKSIHYGDPPNIDCCHSGATMSCDDLRVLEYWRRDNIKWQRMAEFEIELE